jgi:hypothetical protein
VGVHSSYTAEKVAVVLFDEWYCENGLMLHLISDRDALFTSRLWTALHKLSRVQLKMSTSYYPKTDGSSEHTNKTVNQAIQYHINNNQKGWLKKLPCIHFAIMNTVNVSTGFSGFQLKSGRSPRIIPSIVPLPTDASPDHITGHKLITHINTDVQEAQDNLLAAKIHQAYHAHEHRTPEEVYQVGNQVMLSTKNRCQVYKWKGKKTVAKFMPRHDGPYTITHTFPEHSKYTLKLPNNPNTFPRFHTNLMDVSSLMTLPYSLTMNSPDLAL